MSTLNDVVERIVKDRDIDKDSATGAAREFLGQLERLDRTAIDEGDLNEDHAGAIYDAVTGWLDSQSDADVALDEVADAAEKLAVSQAECEFLASVRDQAVVRALQAGASVVDTARSAGVARNSVYEIKRRTTLNRG
ncbi:hypothetical protein I6I10_07485 [Corynebacterium glucuronolyticum]|uniref:Uncharacterized protein n=1 Tax=Corynebacterium glucuronolyticum TaxID=39791 RepID=A0A7T4BN85_9CORY|nr:hypothetical protein [Corynebacterium glucuronolyticum]QQB45323.1 hypothetical protein I6I10_07185 [Corynebacterium glucuronolyticum]QQB45378.1 hypothetical protein I6I10_07485 [Corynebacterium glucuronolyticum]